MTGTTIVSTPTIAMPVAFFAEPRGEGKYLRPKALGPPWVASASFFSTATREGRAVCLSSRMTAPCIERESI